MTNPDLAALSEAATKDNASGFITTEAIFRATLAQLYRSGDLVLIPGGREGMRERVSDQLRAAYTEGATNVHDAWVAGLGQGEADFTEAAYDYAGDTADAAIAAILGEGV